MLQENSIDQEKQKSSTLQAITAQQSNPQLTFFNGSPHLEKLEAQIKGMDLNTLTPVECMMKLNELKMLVKEN